MVKNIILILLFSPLLSFAQQPEHIITEQKLDSTTYTRPALLSFIKNIPSDIKGFTKQNLQYKALKPLLKIGIITSVLMLADQKITNNFQHFTNDNHLSPEEKFKPIISVKLGGKSTNIGKIPGNLTTAIYNIGQGSSAMILAGGFLIKGIINKDNRALTTASELTEAFITLGVGTQFLKYFTGRENPSDATKSGGRWRPFPSWSDFQNHKTKYDAFPSGHMASFISALTIIGENYPEKKWIRPVGFSLAGLCSLAMINNGVHWASDFPLGFALGYGYGKYIAKKHKAFHPQADNKIISL